MKAAYKTRLDKLNAGKRGFPRCFLVEEWPDGSRTCQGQTWEPERAKRLDLVLILRRGEA